MNSRALAAVCVVVLIAAFAIDLVTPQLFVAAILLDIPIVLSTYAGNRRFTAWIVVAALVANVVAGYLNGMQAGIWDAVGLGDRSLSALSIVLVGMLGLAVHRGAERSGAAAALAEQARRERGLREANDRVRASLSEELVEREIVRQGRGLLDAASASFYLAAGAAGWTTRYDARRAGIEVDSSSERPRPEIQSILVRANEMREPVVLSRDDAMGRHVLEQFEAQGVVVAPVADAGRVFGTLLLVLDRAPAAEDAVALGAFAQSAGAALGQARLFVELAQKNDELARRSDVIRDILYALAHDLRTPLAAAGMTLEQARSGAYGPMPEAYLPILDRSVAANDEVQRLAETLLLVAKYESGDHRAIRHAVDVARIARDAASQLEPLAQSKSLRVEVDADGEAIVNGDPGELRRAIVNLFANAVTWSREDGAIRLAVTRTETGVRITVTDDGFGVPEELRQALFKRFGTEGRRGGGTGLGLYIVRRIAEEHGGSVRYAPGAPQGSTFTIDLPAAAVPELVR